MAQFGCVGKTLTHSFSKEIHARLADYDYQLIELDEGEVDAFFTEKAFSAVNVTIPYKQTVIPYLDELSAVAQRIGAVNTVVNKQGKLYGYNTDYYGLRALVEKIGIILTGKKVLILGSGGTGNTARVVAEDMGAATILMVSRTPSERHISYAEAITTHADAQVIINTTPVGMYPQGDESPIDLSVFDRLEGVVDVVYNPLRTNLVLSARERGIPAAGGLYMLVMQAVVAVERFLDTTISPVVAEDVYAAMLAQKENVVLIGMPGSGKSTVGQHLLLDGFAFVDTDAEIEKRCSCSIKELMEREGETYFRDVESTVIRNISAIGGQIIATGGGGVLRPENVTALKRNGRLFFIDVPLDRLVPTEDRPLSDTVDKLHALYEARLPIYRSVADCLVPNGATPEEEAAYILNARMELTL